MQTIRPLFAVALATLLGLSPMLAPSDAAAQDKGQKNGHVKGKHKHDKDRDRDHHDRWERDDDDDDDDRRDRRRTTVTSRGEVERSRAARGRRGEAYRVPPGHLPPSGLCRVWIDGVPPGRQPAPTDCATAVRNRPSNGRVIYGPNTTRPSASRVIVVRDARCADRNGDGVRERVDTMRDGQVLRSVCR